MIKWIGRYNRLVLYCPQELSEADNGILDMLTLAVSALGLASAIAFLLTM